MRKPLFSLKNVFLEVATKETPILDNVSLDIFPGDFVVLIGSNGSGKSSLLKMINGLVKPTKGTLICMERCFLKEALHKKSKEIATLTQDLHLSTFSELTILENCLIACMRRKSLFSFSSKKKERSSIEEHLHLYNPKLLEKLHEPVSALSGGERQTLAFAMILWNNPDLLLLDEHTSALDPQMAAKLMESTHKTAVEKGVTTIMTTHNMQDALRYGNRIVVMKQGRVAFDISAEEKVKLTYEELLKLYE